MALDITQVPSHGMRKIDPIIASALLDAGLNQAQVANKLNVHPSALSRFCSKYLNNQEIVNETKVFTDNLHNVLVDNMAESSYAIHRGLSYFNRLDDESYASLPASVKTATINSANVAFGIAYDKHRLQMGLSTSNIDLHAEFQALQELRSAKQALLSACNNNELPSSVL